MSVGHWQLAVIGINHRTSTLQQREPLQIASVELAKANAVLSSLPTIKESLVLSTCNRVELYFVADKRTEPFEIARLLYEQVKGVDIEPMRGIFFTKKNHHAVDHLFRVTAGIESMVLGENQIVGQARDAYSSACAVKSAGKVIHRLFHQAFRVGKRVRTDTEMGKGACSVSSAAVELLKTRVADIESPTVLFVGINQMINLASSNLAGVNHGRFVFANRTTGKAATFAEKYDGEWGALDQLPELLARADIAISCTGAPGTVISGEMITNAMRSRADRKLVVVDLAVPRDVAVNDGDIPGVEVHDLEAIKAFVKGQQQRREAAIPQAEEIIERKLAEFTYWFEHVRYEPLYNGLDESYETIRKQEMAALMDKLPTELKIEIDQATRQLVDHLLQLKTRTSKRTE